ncbi:calnexin-like [Oppia nitens]|uniref:calnexin-like n=1 Tax=Oppia nitens TaxID=1686743 RepID=UPI0023DB672B|nr:calnexin-like [Oppia nitens]
MTYYWVIIMAIISMMAITTGGIVMASVDDSREEAGGQSPPAAAAAAVDGIGDTPAATGAAAAVDSDDVLYATPNIDNYYIYEHFDDRQDFDSRWLRSAIPKPDSNEHKYDGEWAITSTTQSLKGDSCLIVKSRAKHHAISAKLDKVFKFHENKPLVMQYEVQFRNGQECGGAYLKLLSAPSGDLKKLNDGTQYSIMFGPDKCGNEMKLHFIFQHRNPKNGSLQEKHWKMASGVNKIDELFKDSRWHQLRLEIDTDNQFEITMDKTSVGKGSLLEDFQPPVNPPKFIDDPNDSKPENWDERERIPDPDAVKPDDWDESEPRKMADPKAKKPDDWDEDEPEMIPDSEAKQPGDWDTEMDGEWEAPLIANPQCAKIAGCGKWSQPLIDNPQYKGKWRAPMIVNPAYKGKWAPKKIANPDFYEDPNPFTNLLPIDAVAFELWTISDGIAFDNILITDDKDVAQHISSLTYQIKKELADSETDNLIVKAVKYTNKYPWLWAVYIVAIGIPVVLFIAFCCVSPVKRDGKPSSASTTDGNGHSSSADTTVNRPSTSSAAGGGASSTRRSGATIAQQTTTNKKTDEPQPDDPNLTIVEEDDQKVDDYDDDEEEEETEEQDIEAQEEEEDDDEEEEEEEEDEDDNNQVVVEQEIVEPPVRSSPRLRKSRARKE